MWLVILSYVVPSAVTLYGVMVLVTGEIHGFGTRSVRGTAARILGMLLLSALPLAIFLGTTVHFRPLTPKPDLVVLSREAEIAKEILELHRQLRQWREKHMPAPKDEPSDLE